MYEKRDNPNGAGRKGYFKPEMVEQIFRLALLGMTDKQIAEFLDIADDTFLYWKQNKEEVMDALKRGKQEADSKVAEALYKRAIGYEVTENNVTVIDKKVVITPITKTLPPDAYACLKWLSIRQREQWSDIQRTEHSYSGTININQIVDQLSDKSMFTDEELKLALKLGLNKAVENVGTN